MKWFLIGGLLLAGLQPLFPAEERNAAAAVEKAVAKGVEYLVSRQHTNGVIVASAPPQELHGNAMTALSIMALSAAGHRATDETPAGQALRKALDYILAPGRQDSTNAPGFTPGYYGRTDGSNMYGHGIVTLMLAEMIGMGVDAKQDAAIRDHCQKAIDMIVRSQQVKKADAFKGGWRYAPASADSDLSVTVWQAMALRAAKNAGLVVPKETIADAIAYIKRSYASRRDKDGHPLDLTSAFAYQPNGSPSYSSAAAGLLALQVCGDYEALELKGTAEWLRALKVKNSGIGYFYYGTYYYAQGMYQRGGLTATEAQQLVESLLLAEQKPDGKWLGRGIEASEVYSTAMAILSLSVRHHFMPIYQR